MPRRKEVEIPRANGIFSIFPADAIGRAKLPKRKRLPSAEMNKLLARQYAEFYQITGLRKSWESRNLNESDEISAPSKYGIIFFGY